MKDRMLIGRWSCSLAASMVLLPASAAAAQSRPDTTRIKWSLPTTLPAGALAAGYKGNPNLPGRATFLLSMPNGYRVGPHTHPGFELIKVRKGTLLVGMGSPPDSSATMILNAGDSVVAAEGMPHFWIAKGKTEISLTFDGPYTITYLNADDAPRRKNFPFGY